MQFHLYVKGTQNTYSLFLQVFNAQDIKVHYTNTFLILLFVDYDIKETKV